MTKTDGKNRFCKALLLVFALMLSVLVIPAAAAMPDEEIAEPHQFIMCPKCTDSARVIRSETVYDGNVTVHSCTYAAYSHTHDVDHATEYLLECPYCGIYETSRIYAGYNFCNADYILISPPLN